MKYITIKSILFLNLLNFITSKLFIFIVTLLIFLLNNYLFFRSFDMILPLLIMHFLLYIFIFQQYQERVINNRMKLLKIISFIKRKRGLIPLFLIGKLI